MLLAKDLLLASGGGDFPTDPVRFDYTGAVQEYTVPKGCTKIHVDAVGGGVTTSSRGGRVECDLIVTSGETYYVYVGGASLASTRVAFNGGGATNVHQNYTCGAGATDIRTVAATPGSWYNTSHSSWDTDTSLLSRLVVAGGCGGSSNIGAIAPGGNGGGLVGGTNVEITSGATLSTGGTQTSGGVCKGGRYPACNGVFGKGGDLNSSDVLGGGGGGWYGGGAGYTTGAGGSSYTHPTLCSNVVHTQGYSGANGNGWLIITPLKV